MGAGNLNLENITPPMQGILPSRFKIIDYVQDKTFILWDMGDIINKKPTPEPWICHTYWNEESHEKAGKRLRFICGVLNGSRDYHEIISID